MTLPPTARAGLWIKLTSAMSLMMILLSGPALRAASELRELGPPERILGESEILYKVRRVAFDGDRIVVLTASEPAVHVFTKEGVESWGQKGQGPGDFENPMGLTLGDGEIRVLDARPANNKIIMYSYGGEVRGTRAVPAPQLVFDLFEIEGSLGVAGSEFGQGGAKLLRLDDPPKTVVEIPPAKAEEITLRVEGAPTWTMQRPYTPRPRWTPLSAERYAYWDGESMVVEIRSWTGDVLDRLPLPAETHSIDPADQKLWIEAKFPSDLEIAGQKDPFRELREQAADLVAFPKEFPPVLWLEPEPAGGVWVLRGEKASGQLWTLLRKGEKPRSLHLPPRKKVLTFGERRLAVLSVDDLGVETIEIYDRSSLVD